MVRLEVRLESVHGFRMPSPCWPSQTAVPQRACRGLWRWSRLWARLCLAHSPIVQRHVSPANRLILAILTARVHAHLESLRLAVKAPPDEFDDRFRVMHAQSVHDVVQEGEPVSSHGDVVLPVWSGGAISIICIPQQRDDCSIIVLGLPPAPRKQA